MCLIFDCWPATDSGVVTQVGPGLQDTSEGISTGSGLSLGLGGQGIFDQGTRWRLSQRHCNDTIITQTKAECSTKGFKDTLLKRKCCCSLDVEAIFNKKKKVLVCPVWS